MYIYIYMLVLIIRIIEKWMYWYVIIDRTTRHVYMF